MAVNRYAARCHFCGATVPASGGKIWKAGRVWRVAHLACDAQSGPSVQTFVIGYKEYTRNVRGRCEDAPCCGCCTI